MAGRPGLRRIAGTRRQWRMTSTTPPRRGCGRRASTLPLVGLVSGPLTNLALALRPNPTCRVCSGAWSSWAARSSTAATPPGGRVERQRRPGGRGRGVRRLAAGPLAATSSRSGTGNSRSCAGSILTENVVMTPGIMRRLAAAAGVDGLGDQPLIRVLEDAMRFYFEFHEQQGEGYLAHLHDPLAAAVALDPGLIRTRAATVAVELTER